MDLYFDQSSIENYHSNTQRARVLTEAWVSSNMFCPRCGNLFLNKMPNNSPVADFFCVKCKNEFELKSKNGPIARKVNDGAYETMIERITSNKNPDFFFMNYSKRDGCVKDFILIPKHFFTPDIIEKRKPLSSDARRAGWVGCNIVIEKIPVQGRIEIISNGAICKKEQVIDKTQKSALLITDNISSRGWLMDILNCINSLNSDVFFLEEIYSFEGWLSQRHPNNRHILPKIRQQLQFLRDKGFVEFLGKGKYRRIM